jgi:O-methyltransferase/IclR-like helix-turn-helix domain-containing protein
MMSITASEPTTGQTVSMPPFAELYQLTTGGWVTQAISVAARLGVADAIAAGSTTSTEIAQRVGTHGPTLYRLLRALTDHGVFVESPVDRFALTPVGESLCSDRPGSMRRWAIWTGARFYRDAWSDLEQAVRTGEPSFARVHGSDLFSYLESHPDDAAIFDGAMKDISANFLAGILALYDFSSFATITDVGGGSGTLLATILQSVPGARGVLFDSPEVIPSAEPVLQSAGIGDRCQTVGGDFFAEVPAGADLYILSNIIHDWGDHEALAILRTCRAAMRKGSRLLIIELVLPDDGRPSIGKLLDLEMLSVTPSGRQRTASQYTELLAGAGLDLTNVVLALPGTPASYVEAAPARDQRDD